MASSNLDDLLKSIRDEAKKESALVATDGVSDKDDQLVDEDIDERILRLLGIEDVFDIDYATYKTLLKEKMMAARMSGSEIPTEEAELITNEFKRVKGREGRFKVIKKKISVGDIRRTGPLKGLNLVQENPQKLLAPAKEQQKLSPIDSIIESLSNIVKILQERNKLLRTQKEKNRKNLQNKQRSDKESRAEAGMFGKVLEGAKKVIAPVQNLLGRIFDVFMKVIFGRFLIKFIDWFADPENQGKINAIGTFLRDHWPKLVLAYLLFGNGLGRFIVRITAMLVKGSITLLTKVLPSLLKFVAANPALMAFAAGTALFGAGAVVPALFPQTVEDDADKKANEAAKEKGNEQAAADIRKQNENRGIFGSIGDFFTGAGQEREEQAQRLETGEEKRYGFFGELAGGGQVSGPSGTDVIPARLTDGEFVMSKGAVDAYGTDFMESINAAGGGNNRPKKSSGTIYAAGGGQIGARRGSGYGSPQGGFERAPSMEDESSSIEKKSLPGEGPGSLTPDSSRVEDKKKKKKESGTGSSPQGEQGPQGEQKPKLGANEILKTGLGKEFSDITNAITRLSENLGLPDPVKTFESGSASLMGRMKHIGDVMRGIPQETEQRHAELMKSTNPEKIAAYDAKHGEGAYSKTLKEKLHEIYSEEKINPLSLTLTGQQPTPTGKVVGRENLSPQAQKAIARLEAKKGLPPDMQYTRNGKKISADQFGMVKSMIGAAREGGPKGVLNHMLSGAKGMFGGMVDKIQGAVNDPKSFVESMGGTFRDGNIGKPTAEEQRYIDEHNAGMAKIDAKKKSREEERNKNAAKQSERDRLFGEYKSIVMDEDHPLHRKVAGDLFADDDGMNFEAFKKFKAQQTQPKTLDPKSITPAKRSRMPAPPGPPVQQPPKQVINDMVATGGMNSSSGKPTNNTIPSFNASSRSTDTTRTQKLFGIF